MAKRKSASAKPRRPRTFNGLLKGSHKRVREVAIAVRQVIYTEIPEAEETFHGGRHAMAMYRTRAEICWLQPLNSRCNLYFLRGNELSDPDGLLAGTSRHHRHAKIGSLEQLDRLPIAEWLQESVELNDAAVDDGMEFNEVLAQLRMICLALPKTKETLTWGKPHFRVGEKIFCGCGEQQGGPRLGLKMEPGEARLLIMAPGVEKAPYSRPNDGWVQIDPNMFDDWDEIQQLILGSYRLIAPKRAVALLDRL